MTETKNLVNNDLEFHFNRKLDELKNPKETVFYNKTRKFLLPALYFDSDLWKLIKDCIFYGVGVSDNKLKEDLNISSNLKLIYFCVPKKSKLKDASINTEYYFLDYDYTDEKSIVVLNVGNKDFSSKAYDMFIQGKYSKMLSKEQINKLESLAYLATDKTKLDPKHRNSNIAVFRNDLKYKEIFKEHLEKIYQTSLSDEHILELDFPLVGKQETFNYDHK